MNKGILVVVSGFSGVGKGTVTRKLIEKYSNYVLSVSATTRKPRQGEVNGVHYFFKESKEFEEMINNGEFLEYANYAGNFYGTPWSFVNEQMEKGNNVILEIDLQGALNIKAQRPDTPLVFIVPPSIKELTERLINRGTETSEQIEKRLKATKKEALDIDKYDYILPNIDIDTCVMDLNSIIVSEHYKKSKQENLINLLKEQSEKL